MILFHKSQFHVINATEKLCFSSSRKILFDFILFHHHLQMKKEEKGGKNEENSQEDQKDFVLFFDKKKHVHIFIHFCSLFSLCVSLFTRI